MSTAIAMNPGGGSNAVAPEQANISVPMPDEQIKGSIAGLSTDFTFTVEKLAPRPIVTRANAGHWEGEGGHVIMGAKAGTSDKLCLFEGGIYVALELKAAGRQTPAQAAFQQRVEETTYASGAAAYRALVRLLLAETGRCSTPCS